MADRFPWNVVRGFKVQSLANGNLLVEPDYIEPYRGPEEGGGPGLFTRMRLAAWCFKHISKRGATQPGREP